MSVFDLALAPLAFVGLVTVAIGVIVWREYREFIEGR